MGLFERQDPKQVLQGLQEQINREFKLEEPPIYEQAEIDFTFGDYHLPDIEAKGRPQSLKLIRLEDSIEGELL